MQNLSHGKILNRKNFPTFVETWNEIVSFVQNLRGDGDGNGDGKIKVDRGANGHPVIRLVDTRSAGGGGGGGEFGSSAFALVQDGDTYSVVNNTFYWDGEAKQIADYSVPAGSASVYLVATQSGSESGSEPSWTFSLTNTAPSQSGSTRTIGYRLYAFGADIVTDYRTTFLTVSSPHKVRYFKVAPPTGTKSVTLDTSDNSPSVKVSDGSKTITLDTADLSNDAVKFHTLTVNHADGTSDEYDVLADDDIEVNEASGTVLSDVALSLDGTTLKITKTFVNLETGATSTADTSITAKQVDVITSSTYGNQQFQNYKKQLTVLGADESESVVSPAVFVAVPHSENT